MSHDLFDPNMTPTGAYKPGKIRDQNLTEIIRAAEYEFVRNGFKGTTIQAIADRAGLPKANVHYYFGKKQNLYLAVLNGIVEVWNEQFSQIDVDDDPAEALDNFIREKVRISYNYPEASKLFAMEIISGAPYLKRYLEGEMRAFARSRAKVIQQWIDKGKMRPVDPIQLIFLIWSSTQHYADFDTQVLALMNKKKFSKVMINRISDSLSEIILAGCGLEPPKKP